MSFLQHVENTPLADALSVWLKARNGGRTPLKRDIDPTAFPSSVLPHLFLYQLTEEGRFRCRLCGTGVARSIGRDVTGKYLDEVVLPAAYTTRAVNFRRVLDEHRPMAYHGQMAVAERDYIRFRSLVMPVSTTGDAADILLCMLERLPNGAGPDDIGQVFATAEELDRLAAAEPR